ncbi:iron-sulfur cluster assembly accessory protein [Myxococcota bacterium]|nr:iron-sulfur cluster assembly accessory protein [Myxococcota bacterium]
MSSGSPMGGDQKKAVAASDRSLASLPADWALPANGSAETAAEAPSESVIELTESAQEEVRRLLAAEGMPGLRLGIKGGGCSGLSYLLEFTEEREGDTVVDFEGFKVFLDRKSTIYLRGVTLDHQSGLDGRGFVFHNPQASNTCGCGESFSL